jgi:glyoxylase-like metal-dependent hydrolase (beta-lactamase superfamily II)
VTRYRWRTEVAPGITAIEAGGHTPGHTAFAIASGSATLLYQADVSNVPDLFLRNPDWQVTFDSDPHQAVRTRRRIYDMAAIDRMPVAGYHFPFPGRGQIEKVGSGFRLVAAA